MAVVKSFSLISCPHYAGEILKRSFIPPVRPTVHTNPSRKRSSNAEEFENAGFSSIRVDGKHFEYEALRKR